MFSGIPTDEEQATGLEKIVMKAAQQGAVGQDFGVFKKIIF
ncbi:unnamed protein product [Oncorhynchus mykiss]|uniref:Uncharacterized protein n=1 Tax=Oncorhynchus mykiss TaxID=8022 RepID=A0A060YZA3_ONCMY|nr:unnamed protein product [Oncorhynchus mykiss]